jgi:hypothetical protein
VCWSSREELLRLWSQVGASAAEKSAEDSESAEHVQIVGLLKRTCKIIPDAIDAAQKEQLYVSFVVVVVVNVWQVLS